MLLRHGEHEVGVELREEHEPRAHRHREGQAQGQPVGVEHRQHRVDDAPLATHDLRHPGAGLGGVGEQVGVREHGALGGARGSAGVLDDREIVGRRSRVRLGQRRVTDELGPGGGIPRLLGERGAGLAGLRDRQSERETREPRHRQGDVDRHQCAHPQVGGELLHRAHDLAPDDGVLRAVVFELLAQLARGVERVVFDDHRSEPEHGVERHDVLRAVRQHDRDGVSGAYAVGRQSGCRPRDLRRHVGVGRLASEELQGRGVGVVARRGVDDVDERAGLGSDVLGDAVGVAAGPGTGRVEARHAASLRRGASAPPSEPARRSAQRGYARHVTGLCSSIAARRAAPRELDSTGV